MKNLINIRLENGKTIEYSTFNSFDEAKSVVNNIKGDIMAITAFALEMESHVNAQIFIDDQFICNF